MWRLRGPLQPTPRLVELVTVRLGPVNEGERHVLELIALAEPLAQSTLDAAGRSGPVASLEDRGLIASRKDGRRLQVYLAHPVFGDVVRLGISARRDGSLARALAEASGGRRREDTLHLASLRLVGGGGSPELLLAGAQAARDRRDFELTERMARAAIDNGAGFEAKLLAAEAAHALGRSGQAEEELAALAQTKRPRSPSRCGWRSCASTTPFFSLGQRRRRRHRPPGGCGRRPGLARRAAGPALAPRRRWPVAPAPSSTTSAPLPTRSPAEPRSSLQAVVGDCLTYSGRME